MTVTGKERERAAQMAELVLGEDAMLSIDTLLVRFARVLSWSWRWGNLVAHAEDMLGRRAQVPMFCASSLKVIAALCRLRASRLRLRVLMTLVVVGISSRLLRAWRHVVSRTPEFGPMLWSFMPKSCSTLQILVPHQERRRNFTAMCALP